MASSHKDMMKPKPSTVQYDWNNFGQSKLHNNFSRRTRKQTLLKTTKVITSNQKQHHMPGRPTSVL